jgi:hypothetical protein
MIDTVRSSAGPEARPAHIHGSSYERACASDAPLADRTPSRRPKVMEYRFPGDSCEFLRRLLEFLILQGPSGRSRPWDIDFFGRRPRLESMSAQPPASADHDRDSQR